MKLKHLTALVLALALSLSLATPGFAVEAEPAVDAGAPAAVLVEPDAEGMEETESPGEEETAPAAEEPAPVEETAPAAEESAPDSSEAVDAQAAILTAVVYFWDEEAQEYVEHPEFRYTGEPQGLNYATMQDGEEIPRSKSWTEAWFSDEACTEPVDAPVEPGTYVLRLLDGEAVMAQGSLTITKARQRITVKSANATQRFQKGKKFTLGAKTTGDGELKFKSSDKSVVTVNSRGVLTMKKAGKATITVTAAETEHYEAAKGVVEVALYKKPKKLSYSKSYKRNKYYKRLAKVKLTGTTGQNAVDIALSQLGYKEGRKSGDLSGNGRGLGNWTEYGRFYGMNHQPWCAMFVNWCAREAGASYKTVPKYAAVRYYHSYFKSRKCFHKWSSVRSGAYKPKKGDIILYAYSKGGVAHHIGYVIDSGYENNRVQITTVEGNTNDAVRKVSMNLSKKSSGKHGSHYILGVASPKW